MVRSLVSSSVLCALFVACGSTSPRPSGPPASTPPARAADGGGAGYGAATYGVIDALAGRDWNDLDRDDGGYGYGGHGYGGYGYGGYGYGGRPSQLAAPPSPADPPALAAYLPPPAGRYSRQDPAAIYAVPVDDSPAIGPADARVTIVTTFEFADPYSNRLRPVWDAVRARYGGDVRIVWKHFIVHRSLAQAAALAACAAGRQSKFPQFYAVMSDRVWGDEHPRDFTVTAATAAAADAGLDLRQFDADLRSPRCTAEVIRDQQLFERLGQGAVPVSYINGRVVPGAMPFDSFTPVIDEELAKANAAIAKGVKARDYYATIVAAGRTAP
ncbi:MAG: thioredoxin domain-containing protein [Kofleriaceae bacterium]